MSAAPGKDSKLIAEATRDVFYGTAIVTVVAFVVALRWMPSGKVEAGDVPADEPAPESA
jgi:hypothetical protein